MNKKEKQGMINNLNIFIKENQEDIEMFQVSGISEELKRIKIEYKMGKIEAYKNVISMLEKE